MKPRYLYMDTEPGIIHDTLQVFVDDEIIWEKDNSNMKMKAWQHIEINLKKYRGKQVILTFKFDTVDDKANRTEGVYIDKVRVKSGEKINHMKDS